MNTKEIIFHLNIFSQCRRYGLSLWQCPQFLFLIMGIIIIGSIIFTYSVSTRLIDDPQMVALIIVIITSVLFTIAIIIVQGFERLAEANRLKSEFVSVVSHQLRSPLSNLKWVIELLMSGKANPVSEKELEYLKILKENNDRMVNLVADLLTVSRIQQGKLLLKKENIFLKELIEEKVQSAEIFARASNVEIESKVSDNLPSIMGDRNQIGIVIENILDNAIRYATSIQAMGKTGGKGAIEVRAEEKNSRLYFAIKDNGVGIPQKDQKYIFQKFFRSENILKRQTSGSGLGLYIAKSIIEKSKGKIGFKSEENKGSTFWFTLPIT